MRNKVLVLFFLCWTVQSLPARQVMSKRVVTNQDSNSVLIGNHNERIVCMKKLFQSVPEDKAARKAIPFDSHYKDKYRNDQEFNYNQEEGGKPFFRRLLEKIGRILHHFFGVTTINKYSDLSVLVFKVLCGLAVLAALYFLIRLWMNHKGKWFFQKKDEPITIDILDTEQLIKSADFEQLISETEKQGDTRQIIRLYYLWLLKDLKENKLIVWLPEKTNTDYLSELKEESLRKKFSYLSYLYNYIWYGEFSIGDEDYITAKKAFLNYLKGDRQHG